MERQQAIPNIKRERTSPRRPELQMEQGRKNRDKELTQQPKRNEKFETIIAAKMHL
jgi:hypothetical protein